MCLGQILHIGNFTLRLKSLAATALCRILEQARCYTWSDRLAPMKWSQIAGLVLCMMGLYHKPFIILESQDGIAGHLSSQDDAK